MPKQSGLAPPEKKPARGRVTPEREEEFAFWYIKGNCNGAYAARQVGAARTTNRFSNSASGHFWLKRPGVKAAIRRMRREIHMNAVEVLQRLADQARATVDDVLDSKGDFSIAKARATGAIHLIKEVAVREIPLKSGELMIERKVKLHDAQAALHNLARHHDLLTPMFARQRIPTDPEQLRKRLDQEIKRIQGRVDEEIAETAE